MEPAAEASSRKRTGLIAGALALAVPSVGLGFGVDEHGFRAALASGHASAFDLYRFATGAPSANRALVAHGLLPWWTASGFRLHFLRPLSSLLFAADYRLFGEHAALYHLHSLLWYAALLVITARLFRAVLPERAALLSFAVYGFKNAHVQAYASPAARHVLIAAVWSALALLLLTGAARRSAVWRRAGSVVCLVLALCASEAGLMGVASCLSFELFGDARGDGSSASSRSRRATPLLLAVVYLLIYRAAGAGAAFGGGYCDPLRQPLRFATALPERLFVALGDAFAGVPSELALGRPSAGLVATGMGATALVTWALVHSWSRLEPAATRALRWLLPGALASLVFGLGGLPTGRVLLIADFGFAALLGVLIDATWRAHGSSTVSGAVALGLSALHLVVAPLLSLVTLAHSYRVARATERIAATLSLAPETKRAFVLASDPYAFLFTPAVLADEGRRVCWSVLSAARGEHVVRRAEDGTLELEAAHPLGYGTFETLFRDPALPFNVGATFQQCGAEFHVDQVEQGHVTRFSVRGASSSDAVLLVWNGHRFAPLELGEPSRPTTVAWRPGPARIF